jgi:SAM-dependent methyltransferase
VNKAVSDLFCSVDAFFSHALAHHGLVPQAVDWPTHNQQTIRFDELAKLFDMSAPFSVLDYGCGYGAMLDYLVAAGGKASYWGYDISEAMLTAARKSHPGSEDRFLSKLSEKAVYDYVVASGIFNLKLEIPVETWDGIVHETIERFHALSRRGFAFNMLTSYREEPRKHSRLYYGDPLHFFDLCFRKYSPNIALAHDYDLWDFTIIVRKKV